MKDSMKQNILIFIFALLAAVSPYFANKNSKYAQTVTYKINERWVTKVLKKWKVDESDYDDFGYDWVYYQRIQSKSIDGLETYTETVEVGENYVDSYSVGDYLYDNESWSNSYYDNMLLWWWTFGLSLVATFIFILDKFDAFY